ncbi:MAG TPA: hypothetical protein VIF62_14115 [Labilithrix sp.]
MTLFVATAASADPLPIAPISPAPVPTLRNPPVLTLMCPDPAAASIDYALVSRATQFSGQVRITGTVRNVGGAAYVSGPNQQLALLYEVPIGGRPVLVAQRAFQNLAPGEAVQVSFTRAWSAAIEFPPTYRLIVTYDPDIRLDGNPKNDDCNGGDNVRDRAGSEISALFR